MPIFLAQFAAWLVNAVVIKGVALLAVFGVVAYLVPFALSLLSPFLSTAALTQAFTALPPGVWFFLDYFRFDFGLPLLISAHVARFIIRRLPVIG